MIDRAQLVDDFLNLVRIDSESGHERAVADWLRPRLVQLGGAVSMDHAAQQTGGDCGNLLAQFPGDDRPALLLSAHMDTVKPGCGIRPVLAGGVIRSGGDTILGADDKTGIAAIMAALRAVPATERPPVDVLLTVSEESGLMGARVADLSALRARAGYALDAEGLVGTVTVAAPAHEHFRIDVQGTAAHAGIAPEQGRNAIRALAQLLAAFPQGQLADDTTANIGFVGGGRAHNIVAPEAWAEGEFRSHRPDELAGRISDLRALAAATAAATGTMFQVTTKRQYDAFRVPDDHALLAAVRQALPADRPLVIKSGNGGSDANIFNAAGLAVVVLAAAFEKVHTVEEYVVLNELVASAALLADIMRQWSR